MNTARKRELRTILMEKRREIAAEVRRKIHELRDQNSRRRQDSDSPVEQLESSDFGEQEDVELAIIQMKADTLNRIDQALGRLDRSVYGKCFECDEEIAENRLRALPFAVRCTNCEKISEDAEKAERRRRGPGFVTNVDRGPRRGVDYGRDTDW